MSGKSKIEWTERSWNPVRGCTRVSRGCGGPGPHGGCYAEAIAARFSKPGQPYHGIAEMRDGKPRWTGKLAFSEKALLEPLRRKKPTTYFVNSMSDLFHENMPDEWIDRVFAVMALCSQHVFQVLTKRAARMRAYLDGLTRQEWWKLRLKEAHGSDVRTGGIYPDWPLPNVWLGVSAEDQATADSRIPDLLATPAAVRFCSAEPLLGPIECDRRWLDKTSLHCERGHIFPAVALERMSYRQSPNEIFVTPICDECGGDAKAGNAPGLDWITVGGESGPGARPMHPAWTRDIRDQCAAAGVPFFFKQWGEWTPGENVSRQAGIVDTASKPFCDVDWMFGRESLANTDGHVDDEPDLYRVGKRHAGRLLDGVEHNGMPRMENAHG